MNFNRLRTNDLKTCLLQQSDRGFFLLSFFITCLKITRGSRLIFLYVVRSELHFRRTSASQMAAARLIPESHHPFTAGIHCSSVGAGSGFPFLRCPLSRLSLLRLGFYNRLLPRPDIHHDHSSKEAIFSQISRASCIAIPPNLLLATLRNFGGSYTD